MEVRASIEKRRSSIGKEQAAVEVYSIHRRCDPEHAAENPDMRPRKKMDEVLEYRGFGCVQEEGVKKS